MNYKGNLRMFIIIDKPREVEWSEWSKRLRSSSPTRACGVTTKQMGRGNCCLSTREQNFQKF